MGAKVITQATVKGGSGKTTTAATTAWCLSEKGYKVLAIDGDPQGNMTEIFYLTPVRELRLQGIDGILEAVREKNPRKYIRELTENLDLLIGQETFGVFPDCLYTEFSDRNKNTVIKESLIDLVRDDYDFIIIDTAPTLNSTLTNFLTATDYLLGVFVPNKFCYSSLYTLYETTYLIRENLNPHLDFLGILISQVDIRRSDQKDFIEIIRTSNEFGPLCFDAMIKNKAATGRLPTGGFFENSEMKEGIAQFEPYIEELIKRINERNR